MVTWQYTETFIKEGFDITATFKNEEDDKILINAWYDLWIQFSREALSSNDFIKTLVSASAQAERIRLNQN